MAKTYISPDEVLLLEKAARTLRDRLLTRLLFHLGCRVSEALALKASDVDFTRRTVTILHLKHRVNLWCSGCGARLGIGHSFCPKCGSDVTKTVSKSIESRRQRQLPIDQETLQMLQEYVSHAAPAVTSGLAPIFGINRHRAWQIVKECADAAGLAKLVNPETGKIHNVSPHKLRDAFAVHAVKVNDTGDGLRMLQEHLGHASFNTTAKYRKVSGQEHQEWYGRLWAAAPEDGCNSAGPVDNGV